MPEAASLPSNSKSASLVSRVVLLKKITKDSADNAAYRRDNARGGLERDTAGSRREGVVADDFRAEKGIAWNKRRRIVGIKLQMQHIARGRRQALPDLSAP